MLKWGLLIILIGLVVTYVKKSEEGKPIKKLGGITLAIGITLIIMIINSPEKSESNKNISKVKDNEHSEEFALKVEKVLEEDAEKNIDYIERLNGNGTITEEDAQSQKDDVREEVYDQIKKAENDSDFERLAEKYDNEELSNAEFVDFIRPYLEKVESSVSG